MGRLFNGTKDLWKHKEPWRMWNGNYMLKRWGPSFQIMNMQTPWRIWWVLKQVNTVEEYYKEFESLLNLLQLPDNYALSVFISNLKSDLSKFVRLFYPKTLNHALSLAKKMESLVYNLPRKPFTPYRNTSTTTTIPYQPSNTTKLHYTMGHNTQTGLLPTPRLPALPYHI